MEPEPEEDDDFMEQTGNLNNQQVCERERARVCERERVCVCACASVSV